MKRLFFFAVILLINYAALEGVAYVFYKYEYGDYSPTALVSERDKILAQAEKGAAFTQEGSRRGNTIATEVTHPYVGYVTEGKTRIEGCEGERYECFERIKTVQDEPMPKRGDKNFVVGVLGGSVAVGTINASSKNAYSRFLKRSIPSIADKNIEIVTLAAGGYHQPQQMLLLNYMLSRGAEFDLLINIDGFNEIAIPSSEYKRSGLHPSFPRSWEFRIGRENSPAYMDMYVRKKILDDSANSAARFANKAFARSSPIVNLIWRLRQSSLQNQQAQLATDLAQLKNTSRPREFMVEELGPELNFTNWDDFNQGSIEQWMRSSFLINAVAQAHGARYFHFLQPNQYVEGSKPLTEREKQIAILEGQGYGERYRLAYPKLKENAVWLTENGVDYTDLSNIYSEETKDIYIDNCCHVNHRGSDLIISAAAEHIGKNW